jgi:nitrate reductase (NAD(P)H)
MAKYHIGTLTDEARAALAGDEMHSDPNATPSPTFLEPRSWKKATLHAKKTISADTKVFTFKLEHDAQLLGLPTGQHLMIRLRDPVTREAIIRSYTPISETSQRGYMDVLVKLYLPDRTHGSGGGGKMSVALDSIPIGHAADFKGPTGKFQYRGRGVCAINGAPRTVRTFYMICGGSGITPIYQVLRACMQDRDDATRCVVLDGNRAVDDILCKADLDGFAREHGDRCRVLYTLTKASDEWTGLRGRIAAPLLREHVDRTKHGAGEAMVLICGPGALEESCREALLGMGWGEDELLFF